VIRKNTQCDRMNSNATHPREIITTCMAIDMAGGSSWFLLLARSLQRTVVKTQKRVVVEATVTMRCGSILQIDAETCCCCRISLFVFGEKRLFAPRPEKKPVEGWRWKELRSSASLETSRWRSGAAGDGEEQWEE